jgi:hypothetical protein
LSSPLNTAEGFAFVPFSPLMTPDFVLQNDLLDAFKANDERKNAWTKTGTINSQAYTYPFKYKTALGVPGAAKTEYNMVLRLAEQYLIRAEARAAEGKITGTNSAESDLNIIRNRAGLGSLTLVTATDAAQAIEQENRIEFFTEWGHRWLDLKRWGIANAVLTINKGASWQATDVLYPIPEEEILTNTSLTQNPGY